jgi:hypothetical protein
MDYNIAKQPFAQPELSTICAQQTRIKNEAQPLTAL